MSNINDLQEQFENLIKQGQELLEKMKENHIVETNEKVKRWKPKDLEKYYSVACDGDIKDYIWDGGVFDSGCYKLGNCFKTYGEAQKELDRMIAEQELLDMVDAKTSDENYKWFIEYDPRGEAFYPNQTVYRFATTFIFSSKESCQQAINTLGEEKLKLIFRID